MTRDLVLSARTLDRIARFHGDGLPVVSTYLGVEGGAAQQGRRARQTALSRGRGSTRAPLSRRPIPRAGRGGPRARAARDVWTPCLEGCAIYWPAPSRSIRTRRRGHGARAAESILEPYELDEQRRLVAELLQSAAAGDRTAVGLEPCMWAGAVAAIGTLLVQEGAAAPGVLCEASGWFATSGDTCPLCGRATRHTPDVINELVEAMIDEGGAIHHVRADTELRGHLTAVWPRFALPPIPEPT